MTIDIRPLKKADEQKAIDFAIKGMHFDWYMDNPMLLQLYGRYFWYLEKQRATEILAAYHKGEFVGVLLAEMAGEKPLQTSWLQKTYVSVAAWLQKTFFKEAVGPYDQVNQQLYQDYCQRHQSDGEIIFLAADPEAKVKGVGTALLTAFEERQAGKRVHLYTDAGCTYQFYDRRGFTREGAQTIRLDTGRKQVDLDCFLYSKVLG